MTAPAAAAAAILATLLPSYSVSLSLLPAKNFSYIQMVMLGMYVYTPFLFTPSTVVAYRDHFRGKDSPGISPLIYIHTSEPS